MIVPEDQIEKKNFEPMDTRRYAKGLNAGEIRLWVHVANTALENSGDHAKAITLANRTIATRRRRNLDDVG